MVIKKNYGEDDYVIIKLTNLWTLTGIVLQANHVLK